MSEPNLTPVIVYSEYLTAIANAIRQQLNVQTTYTPSEMASAIYQISSGGGGAYNNADQEGM